MSRIACFAVILCSLLLAVAAQAEPRTALVVGNGAYGYGRLANAVNDATDMAAALQADGFEVILKTDADQATMDAGITELSEKLKAKGGVGLFYFSGHGLQVGSDNFILPIGEALARESDVKYKAINVAQVIDAMAGNELNIVILDACRNNPLGGGSRSATRGLARVEGGAGLFVSFATSPGAVALDGDGRNSPYTGNLVASLRTPGLSLEETFKRTLKAVHQETKGEQTPWISSSFFGDFVFRQREGTEAANPPTPAPTSEPEKTPVPGESAAVTAALPQAPAKSALLRQVPARLQALSGLYRASGANPDGSNYTGMVAITRSGAGYRFDWWIGKQHLQGIGHFAGKMLVVDWGEPHPVIYTFAPDGRLAGEWADGSATEDLYPYATAEDFSSVGGSYEVEGRGKDAKPYTGTLDMRPRGNGFDVTWHFGADGYRGKGVLNGNVLVVEWGQSSPAVYALQADGRLVGMWDSGAGEETLTPER